MPSGQSAPLGLRSAQPERLPNAGTEKVLFRLAARLACRVNRRARDPNRDCCGWSGVVTILSFPLRWILSRHRMTALARMKVPLFKDFGNAQGFVTS